MSQDRTPAEQSWAKESGARRARIKELHALNGQLIEKAKKAPFMAKAATIEQLADNQQELNALIIELL